MSNRYISGQQRGFSLFEVLVASALLSVAVLGFLRLSTHTIKKTALTRQYLHATTVAQNAIAYLHIAPSFLNWLASHKQSAIISRDATLAASLCTSPVVSAHAFNTWCSITGNALARELYQRLQQDLSRTFAYQKGSAIICFTSLANSGSTSVRINVIWDNGNLANTDNSHLPLSHSDCPTSYSATTKNTVDYHRLLPAKSSLELYTTIAHY